MEGPRLPQDGATIFDLAHGACPWTMFQSDRSGLLSTEAAGENTAQKDVKEQSYRSRSKQKNGVNEASKQSYRFRARSTTGQKGIQASEDDLQMAASSWRVAGGEFTFPSKTNPPGY
jgi:hypothetical protein